MTAPVVVAEALKGASAEIAEAGEPAQEELFALPCLDPSGEIEAARSRGLKGGRPKGATNLMTRDLREYLTRRMGGTPQEGLAKWWILGPVGLAKALNCSRLEAFVQWKDLGDKLGRYFMAPMVAIDDQGKPAPSFTVVIGGNQGVVTAAGEQRPPWEYLSVQNQELSGDDTAKSKEGEDSE
jgi:hypothetical protein